MLGYAPYNTFAEEIMYTESEEEVLEGPSKNPNSVFKEDRNRDSESAIQSVNSGAKISPTKTTVSYNIYDIITRVALVFTLISLIVLWIIHTIKDRKDPLRKYLR